MRIVALTKRIIIQILHDKRTMALILVAPILVLGMIQLILNAESKEYTIGVNNASDEFIEELRSDEENTFIVKNIDQSDIEEQIKKDKIDGAVTFDDDQIKIYVSGVDASVATKVQVCIKNAQAKVQKNMMKVQKEINYKTDYVVGKEDGTLFDKFGTQLIGVIVFFFVFLIAGINFLGERTSGTMEKLLSTPIRRYEIVVGYVLGFSVLALLQSALVTLFAVYVLGLEIEGNIILVLLITLLTAINALTFGILLSTIANSEFQMIQFIPIVILPQVFFCGLFRLSGIWEKVGYCMPLHYTSQALTKVMVKGNGITDVYKELGFLLEISIIFILVNVKLLKKQREI